MDANLYRPHSLNDVIGQATIVKALRKYFNTGSFPNCSIFCGTSGSGKNTLANIVAQTLSCRNPAKDTDGNIEPCHTCPSCQMIEKELPNSNIIIYNGGEMKADDIYSLSESLQYDPQGKRIIIINEAQRVTSISKLLEIIEVPRKDTYFIFTSTDTQKFKNIGKQDNKSQEQAAMRSRIAYFNIKPIAPTAISSLLFDIIEKESKEVPDSFLETGIHTIAEGSKGNVRQAINDLNVALTAEVYDEKELQELLGYEDEKGYVENLLYLLKKDVRVLDYLLEDCKDIAGFFNYSWFVLNETCLKTITKKTFANMWKETNAQEIIATGMQDILLSVYENTNQKCYGFFNEKIFINEVYRYFSSPKGVTRLVEEKKVLPKKIPRV
jgi:DNA polymerase III gamma/tau subunit